MQKHPTPHLDSSHDGHFLSRLGALDMVNGDSAFTDLKDLPSSNDVNGEKYKKKLKVKRGKEVSNDAGLKSWERKKVRAFLHCYDCAKRRCVSTTLDDQCGAAMGALQQILKSVSYRFCCVDLLFDNSNP